VSGIPFHKGNPVFRLPTGSRRTLTKRPTFIINIHPFFVKWQNKRTGIWAPFFARRRAKKPGFPLQVLGFAYANPVGFPLQSLAPHGLSYAVKANPQNREAILRHGF
jgi:hypothetical protein